MVWSKTKWSFPLVYSRGVDGGGGGEEGGRVSETGERSENMSKKYGRNSRRKNKRKKTK